MSEISPNVPDEEADAEIEKGDNEDDEKKGHDWDDQNSNVRLMLSGEAWVWHDQEEVHDHNDDCLSGKTIVILAEDLEGVNRTQHCKNEESAQ